MKMADIETSYIDTVSDKTLLEITTGQYQSSFQGHTLFNNQYIFAEGKDYVDLKLQSLEECKKTVKKKFNLQ